MAASRFVPPPRGALAATLAAAALLAGCGEHHVAPVQEASAPVLRADALAGAPVEPGPPPPAYVAPAPPPPPGPPPAASPAGRDVIYDLGPVVRPQDTMAPVPNPPERDYRTSRGREVVTGRREAYTRSASVYAFPARAPSHRRAAPSHTSKVPAPRPAAASVHASGAPLARPAASPAHAKPGVAPTARSATAPSAASGGASAKPVAAPREATPPPGPTPRSASPSNTATTQTSKTRSSAAPAPPGDRAARLAALQTELQLALRDEVGRTAVLNVPTLKPDQPADVTLTLPADFASTVRDEAAKQGLQDAAASVNVTALLAGDGYAVAPDETQSQPLTVGQPTEFHWTVTAPQGAKGPLRADVGADLLGGGDQALQLGSVAAASKGGFHVSPRAWGAALLVLLAVIVFAWLSRGGRAASARRRRNAARPGERRFDMAERGAPPPPPYDREP